MSKQDSDEVKEMYCEPCCKDGFRNSKAGGFCVSCVEFLCATCLRYHRKHLPDHKLQNKNDMPQDFCLVPCPSHSGEIVKFYCDECDDFACPQCKKELHANCTAVTHLPMLAANFENSAEMKNLDKKVNKTNKELHSVQRMIKNGKRQADTLRNGVFDAMKRQRDYMNLRYDHLEKQINTKTVQMYNNDKAGLEKQSNKATVVGTELASLQADIQNTRKALERCNLFIKSKSAYKLVDCLTERLEQIKEEVIVQDYSYEPVEYVPHETELGTIRTNGKVKLRDRTELVASYIRLEARMAVKVLRELRKSQKYMLIIVMILLAVLDIKVHLFYIFFSTAIIILSRIWFVKDMGLFLRHGSIKYLLANCVKITEWTFKDMRDSMLFRSLQQWFEKLHSTHISVKSTENDMCNITGLCFLSANHIVAIDNENSSVKIIHIEKQSVITELTALKKPWDVTKIGDDRVAITFPHSEAICFLQLKYCFSSDMISLSLARTISVQCTCYGIVYTNNKLVITTCGNDSGVKILDLDGNTLQTYRKDDMGENLFWSPYYVIISRDHNTVYVSDFRREQVTRLSMDGNVLAVYKNRELTNLFGMTTDETGKLYVCGLRNIYMLSEDLLEDQKLKDVDRPLNSIAYCDKTNTFCVTSWEHNNIICFNIANRI